MKQTQGKERPILFSGPMVREILEGRKTQTRRVVKPQPEYIEWFEHQKGWCGGFGPDAGSRSNPVRMIQCPYGKPGDRLWVRETWAELIDVDARFDGENDRYRASYPDDRPYLIPPHDEGRNYVLWRADGEVQFCDADGFMGEAADRESMGRWRPSIHMPRWASRITLEVVSVRVERLQEISEADAIAEGIGHSDVDAAVASYASLWDRINGPGSWAANPWVWMVEFRKVEGGAA